MVDKRGVDVLGWGMAKQRKAERVTEREEIEQIWAFCRKLDQRVAAIENELDDDAFNDGFDKLVAKAMAARPWYAKLWAWGKTGDTSWATLGFAILAFVLAMVALIA